MKENSGAGVFAICSATNGILTTEKSAVIANYLIKSELDSYAKYIFSDPGFNIPSIQYAAARYSQATTLLDSSLVTADFVGQQQKMKLLQNYLISLSTICKEKIYKVFEKFKVLTCKIK